MGDVLLPFGGVNGEAVGGGFSVPRSTSARSSRLHRRPLSSEKGVFRQRSLSPVGGVNGEAVGGGFSVPRRASAWWCRPVGRLLVSFWLRRSGPVRPRFASAWWCRPAGRPFVSRETGAFNQKPLSPLGGVNGEAVGGGFLVPRSVSAGSSRLGRRLVSGEKESSVRDHSPLWGESTAKPLVGGSRLPILPVRCPDDRGTRLVSSWLQRSGPARPPRRLRSVEPPAAAPCFERKRGDRAAGSRSSVQNHSPLWGESTAKPLVGGSQYPEGPPYG